MWGWSGRTDGEYRVLRPLCNWDGPVGGLGDGEGPLPSREGVVCHEWRKVTYILTHERERSNQELSSLETSRTCVLTYSLPFGVFIFSYLPNSKPFYHPYLSRNMEMVLFRRVYTCTKGTRGSFPRSLSRSLLLVPWVPLSLVVNSFSFEE